MNGSPIGLRPSDITFFALRSLTILFYPFVVLETKESDSLYHQLPLAYRGRQLHQYPPRIDFA